MDNLGVAPEEDESWGAEGAKDLIPQSPSSKVINSFLGTLGRMLFSNYSKKTPSPPESYQL